MTDAHTGAARGRPRTLVKAKAPHHSSSKQHDVVMLPKLRFPSNKNSNNQERLNAAMPFSPRAREIPVALPVAPYPPGHPARPVPSASSTASSSVDLESPRPLVSAWSTPRSPAPEEQATTKQPSSSPLESFFATDGTSLTPPRLQTVEETLIATAQLYDVDWSALHQENDKFFEISDTAARHLDTLHSDIPGLHAASKETRLALTALSEDITILHAEQAEDRETVARHVTDLVAEHNRGMEALIQAHAEEQASMEREHEQQVQEIRKEYQDQLRELEAASSATERACLNEIESLKNRMASQLEQQRDKAASELEQLRTKYESELEELRRTSEAELATLRDTSGSAYQQLLTSSQKEISDLKTSSADEIERLLQASASTLADVTGKLSSELQETREQSASQLASVRASHELETTELKVRAGAAELELGQRHQVEVKELQTEWKYQVFSLCAKLEAAEIRHADQVEKLSAKATAEITATRTMLVAENTTLTKHFTQEIESLRSSHKKHVEELTASYDHQISELEQSHKCEMEKIERDTARDRQASFVQHEAHVNRVQDDAKFERERLELRYESELDSLRRVTATQITKVTKERDDTVQQLREAHAARVLSLETSARDTDKRHNEERESLTSALEAQRRRVQELEDVEKRLRNDGTRQRERANEDRSRFSMRLEEMEAAIVFLERAAEESAARIDSLKRDLRASDDDRQTKAATILELTFVIKSRDDEVEKLRMALLDSIQNITAKTEILEQTNETLTSKAKELEAAKAALRLESGRLSMVEEDAHQKEGMLEDSGLKIENLRLQLENLRLEMKRLQMDMKLQHEHSAGEMELKQGEIRRLHAAQLELRQKNDIHQETIVRLEAQLAAAVRQGDELRRRAELLKVETSQHLGEASQLADRLLEKDTEVVVLKGERQVLQGEVNRLQIQGNNLQCQVQVQREKLETQLMRTEDVHCQYQRCLEMTAAEKDERLKYERYLLQLELSTVKESLKQAQDVASELGATKAELASAVSSLNDTREEKRLRDDALGRVEGERAALEDTRVALTTRIAKLEELLANSEQQRKTNESLAAALAGDAIKLEDLQKEKDTALAEATSDLEQARSVAKELEDKACTLEASKRELEETISVVNERLSAAESEHDSMLQQLSAMEKTLNAERESRSEDVRNAEALALEKAQYDREEVEKVEQALEAERKERATIRGAHDEANSQIAYLIITLKQASDSHAIIVQELQDAVAMERQKTETASVEVKQQTQAELDRVAAEVTALRDQLTVQQEAKDQELSALRAQHEAELCEIKATSETERDRVTDNLRDLHVKQIAEVESTYTEKVNALELAVSDAQATQRSLASEIEVANEVNSQLMSQMTELQLAVDEKERKLRENEEVLRVRKATIENVRKEMALYMEMHKNTSDEGVNAATGAGENPSVPMEQSLTLLKHQLETYVNEAFHVEELPSAFSLGGEDDLRRVLKDALRMQCCLSTIGRSRVLSIEQVCSSLETLQRILSAVDVPSADEDSVLQRLNDWKVLQARVCRLINTEESGEQLCASLESYASVLDRLRSLVARKLFESDHESTKMIAVIEEHEAMSKVSEALMNSARGELQMENVTSLADLGPVLAEAAALRRIARTSSDQVDVDSLKRDIIGARQVKALLDDHSDLVSQLLTVLETAGPQSTSTIVAAVAHLMRVLHAFESLSSRHGGGQSGAFIIARVNAVVGFVDELRLLSQFAQNILDEEAEATIPAAGDASNSRSASSLLSLRAALTRTPTPTADLALATAENEETHISDTQDEPSLELMLSDDALAPRDVDAVCPSDALSDSLMDISLVMNDHHRILSEAAHWVGKVQSLSPRSKRPSPSSSFDFAGELIRLVRDHCSLLSLSRRLFCLQDPRQDLLSVLQCLAVLTRLTTRLRVFSSSDSSMAASDSKESLQSASSFEEANADHKLQASLSVFAAMDEMARHLQDYDAFVQRVQGTCRPLVHGGVGKDECETSVESVVDQIVERLVMMDQLRVSLGLTNVMDELPVFVSTIQSLAQGEEVPMDVVLTSVRQAFSDSDEFQAMLGGLRETLPFTSSVESPQELLDHVKETLTQCDTLITDRQEVLQRAEALQIALDQIHANAREEDTVLYGEEDSNESEPRMDRLRRLVQELRETKEKNDELAAEQDKASTLLESAGYDPVDRLHSLATLIDAVSTLKQEKSDLENTQALVQEAVHEERAFLATRGVQGDEHASRQQVYEALLTQLNEHQSWRQQVEQDLTEEASFLTERGLPLELTPPPTWPSRLAVYTTLLEQQSKLIDERVEREVKDQQQRAELECELDQLKAIQQQQLEHQREETAFLQRHGLSPGDLLAAGARIQVYEALLNRETDLKQQLAAWDGSPHSDARGCRQADERQQQAITAAVAAAVESQRQQLDFRQSMAVAAENDTASANDSRQAVELLAAFTKRDNAVVGMIYRLIRLVTDILNTSTFSTSNGGGGTLPVEHTQSVLGCVKELKALKEYLLQSLEQITKDHAAYAAPAVPALVRRDAAVDNETAIDFAVLLHREHAAAVHKRFLEHDAKVKKSIASLRHSLAGHADVFTDTEAHRMALEMQLTQEVAGKQALETQLATQDQFLQSFADERKQVEAALTEALEEAKREQQALVKKMELLATERSDAMAGALAGGNTPLIPRTPLTSSSTGSSRGLGTAVVPTRPERPRELTSSRIKSSGLGTGTAHKERFVSDLEKETGQRRTTAMSPTSAASRRRANEWRRHELLSSSSHIEQQFRAISDEGTGSDYLAISPSSREVSTQFSDQELWYQGVRLLHHVSFFVSVFFVPKQKTFRVEVFNSDSEQQQTIYVTLNEMRGFVAESKRATRLQVTLEDPTKHGDVVDVLFERIKVVGGGDSSNLLFAFQ